MPQKNVNHFHYSLPEIETAAKRILECCTRSKVWGFRGQLGSGKTTLIRTLVKLMGGNPDDVSSPSYTLLNLYSLPQEKIYHFDLYRIHQPEELESIGFFESLATPHYIFIEWVERAQPFLTVDHYCIEIQFQHENPLSRTLTIHYNHVCISQGH